MANRFSKGGRDANEARLLEIARAYGYVSFDDVVTSDAYIGSIGFWQQGDENDGVDLMFVDSAGVFFVEVKNGKLPPSKKKLTPREKVFKHLCEAFRLPHYVIENGEQMNKLLANRKVIK